MRRGIEMGDHLTISRYIMLRVTESHDCICSFEPKPKDGDWNGAGCHTNFSVEPMRADGGFDVIVKVCEAFAHFSRPSTTGLMSFVGEELGLIVSHVCTARTP